MKPFALVFIACICLYIKPAAAQKIEQPRSATLNHIAVYVSDLEKSGTFYQSLLNLIKIQEPFKDGKHIWFSLGAAGQLHLIKGELQKTAHDKNEHLCFSVTSVTDFITKLDQRKIDYSNWPGTAKEPTVRVDGVKQIYFQDPDGHWLEVNDAH